MKYSDLIIAFIFSAILLLFGCGDESLAPVDEAFSLADRASVPSGSGQNDQSGLITAGEWSDLEEWSFWTGLMDSKDHSDKAEYWDFHPAHRVSLIITDNNQAVIDADIKLLKGNDIIWEAKSDNHGKAELWINLYEQKGSVNISDYSLRINDQRIDHSLKLYSDGINQININNSQAASSKVDISFIVDATGSMGDELEFLKDDLADVIDQVRRNNSTLDIRTASVFYRDEGDDYVVRRSELTEDLITTLDFITEQSAGGGGDFPEAVHSAMTVGIEELRWSTDARTRIAFLLLDAPPHHDSQVIKDLQESIRSAARQGIKVIPITASGIDKETEFLMRFFAISTNSTYVFITDHSGIGEDHIEPTVGDYEVEYLNELMVRLIEEYTE